MSVSSRSPLAAALCFAAFPQIAAADVSTDDVWANLQAYVGAFGGELTGTLATTGDITTVTGIGAHFVFPFDMGTADLTQSEFSMRDNGDGSVTLIYPPEMTYSIQVDIPDEGRFQADILVGHSGMQANAKGTPDKVTYTYSADAMTVTPGDWSVPEDKMDGPVAVTMSMAVQDIAGHADIATGDLIATTMRSTVGEQKVAITWSGPDSGSGTGETHVDSARFSGAFELPAGGSDLMNLAAAIRDSLRFDIESQATGYESTQTTQRDGESVTTQSNGYASSSYRVSLGKDGFNITGDSTGFFGDFLMPEILPMPIGLNGETARVALTVPLASGQTPQPFAVATKLDGLSLSEDIWALFDPGAGLPRDPVHVALDLSGTMRNLADLLDFNALIAMSKSGTVPVELHSLSINDLRIAAAGAELTGAGAARFDNSDLESYRGMPKPVGQVDLTLTGANGLLDALVGIGVMTDQDAMGARMGLATVTKAMPKAGDDVLTSQVEFTDDGQVLANGLRIK